MKNISNSFSRNVNKYGGDVYYLNGYLKLLEGFSEV